MIPQHIFRAYDIRGVYPNELNAEAAELIGKGFGTYVRQKLNADVSHSASPQGKLARHDTRVVVGCDARNSSPELHLNFLHGLASTGCHVTDIGLTPTPLLYFANTVGGFDAGCNITASHNPSQYNGFKFVGRNAHAIYGEQIQEIYKIIEKGNFEPKEGSSPSSQNDTGKADYFELYQKKLQSIFSYTRSLKIVVDTGNGVAGAFYPKILRALGHEVTELYSDLNGSFPNHEPDPTVEKNLADLKTRVIETKADLGLAFDGDGDRLGIIAENGEFINADRILMLLTQDVLRRYPGAALVYTVSNSQLLFDMARSLGGKPFMCKVGHSYVENAMYEHNAMLGGEQSGHFFLPENYYGFDDAMVAACRLLKIIDESGSTISKTLAKFPHSCAIPELRLHCPDDKKFEIIEKIQKHFAAKYPCNTLDGARIEFGEGAWAGIRASNTSPCLSFIAEAASVKKLNEIKTIILNHLKNYPEIKFL